jgi:exosortase/archaeosortase family protein
MPSFQFDDFQIPGSVKLFAIKVILLFVLWEIIYTTVLFPTRIPDGQLSAITAAGTAKLLGLFYRNDRLDFRLEEEGEPKHFKDTVYINDQKLIGIADGCNAFELQVLYLCILICMQQLSRKTIWYCVIGIPLISICNILRCSIIGWLNISKHLDLSIFAHHYLFKLLMYCFIFFAWVSYSKAKNHYV